MICKQILLITFLNQSEFIFCTQLNGFKYSYVSVTIQLNISYLFVLIFNSQAVPFNPLIGPYQVLSLCVRVDLAVMAMRGTPLSPNLQGWNLTIRLFNLISRTLVVGCGFIFLPRCNQCILMP